MLCLSCICDVWICVAGVLKQTLLCCCYALLLAIATSLFPLKVLTKKGGQLYNHLGTLVLLCRPVLQAECSEFGGGGACCPSCDEDLKGHIWLLPGGRVRVHCMHSMYSPLFKAAHINAVGASYVYFV